MSSTWSQCHHRTELIGRVTSSPETPLADWFEDPEFRYAFDGTDDLVRALHQQWVTILHGCIDAEPDLCLAYRRAATAKTGLRKVLDLQSDSLTLRRLTNSEYLRLGQLFQVDCVAELLTGALLEEVPAQLSWRQRFLTRRVAQPAQPLGRLSTASAI